MKLFKNLEEKYIKELEEIEKKYPVNYEDIKMIEEVCNLETPEIRIKNSEKVEFCNNQKECCKYLYHKIHDALDEYELKEWKDGTNFVIDGYENEYKHTLPPSTRTPDSIYNIYQNRQNQARNMLRTLMNKLNEEFTYFYHENSKQIKGNQGEELVEKYFSLFANKYPSRMNVILPIQDAFAKSSEIDSLIVTPKGILVCEIKNWGNEKDSVYIHRDDTWYVRKNGRKEKQKNPFEQNIRHVMALEEFLKQNGITCKLIPVVIIADNKVEVINDGNSKTILKSSAVYEYIENLPLPETIDKETQNKILNLLDNLRTEENSFPCKDIISVSAKYEEAISKAFKLRKTECALEKELFEKCTKIINTYNLDNPIIHIVIIILLIAILVAVLFLFSGVFKFIISMLILGAICGGLSSD